jgi:hypothetical protein
MYTHPMQREERETHREKERERNEEKSGVCVCVSGHNMPKSLCLTNSFPLEFGGSSLEQRADSCCTTLHKRRGQIAGKKDGSWMSRCAALHALRGVPSGF